MIASSLLSTLTLSANPSGMRDEKAYQRSRLTSNTNGKVNGTCHSQSHKHTPHPPNKDRSQWSQFRNTMTSKPAKEDREQSARPSKRNPWHWDDHFLHKPPSHKKNQSDSTREASSTWEGQENLIQSTFAIQTSKPAGERDEVTNQEKEASTPCAKRLDHREV